MSTSLDPASSAPLGRDPRAFDEAWPLVDVVLANADEAAVLTGLVDPAAACAALAERAPCAVVKLGAAGARAASGTEQAMAPADPVEARDTTGAGDAFAAGFLPAWLGGATLAEALAAGCHVAGRAVLGVGAEPEPNVGG